jgi:large subunit ribosomal protein L23
MATPTTKQNTEVALATEAVSPKPSGHAVSTKVVLMQPRLSEKATTLASQHKYVFKVGIRANKVEVKKAVEKAYGVKVSFVNILRMEGKKRRYGKSQGSMSDFKKAVVTLTKDSKGIDIVEAS